jgi:pSer/pThr/pTyr-binding forkhead associated (FHA) protein
MDRTNTLTLLGKPSGAQPYIELLVGKEKGKVYELSRDHLSIGRSDESDILFASDAVSRIHALMSKEAEGWVIRDNNSKNGIQVNGTKADNQRLQSGDLVQVGDFVFRFVDPATQMRAKAKTKARKVNLAETNSFRALRGAPSPVWFFGAVLGCLVYFLLSPALVPSKPAVQRELVISAPASAKDEAAPSGISAQAQLNAAAIALTTTQLEATAPQPKPAAPPETENPPVRPITKEDLSIKTVKAAKKVEPGKSLKIYLEEGQHYLSQGDFESASIAFNFAILIDPRNESAIAGMQAAQAGTRNVSSGSPARDAQSVASAAAEKAPPGPSVDEKKNQIKKLFDAANGALLSKRYQRAIDNAEEIRRIEIKGETVYLNEAKQIIDQAKIRQKDEFEPFIKQANSMISEGAFRAARELCDQMLKRDDAYVPAKECRDRADDGLGRQASSGGAK